MHVATEGLNRTRVELKQYFARRTGLSVVSLNRTRVELKPSRRASSLLRRIGLNRTRVELKPHESGGQSFDLLERLNRTRVELKPLAATLLAALLSLS